MFRPALCATAAILGISFVAPSTVAAAPPRFGGGAAGGRIAVAAQNTSSVSDAFRREAYAARAYFGPSEHLIGIVRSRDGRTMIAGFDAVRNGRPLTGAIVAASPGGNVTRVAIMFDDRARFAQSVRPLFTEFAATLNRVGSSTGESIVSLHAVQANDGTVSARVASGWHVDALQSGVFAASGPNGEEVDQEVPFTFTDPRSPLRGRMYPSVPYPGTPAAALATLGRLRPTLDLHVERVVPERSQSGGFQVAEVGGTERLKNGANGRFAGLVGLSPLNPYGTWTVTIKLMAAPAASFGRELPTLSAIYESYLVNQGNRAAQVRANIASNQALSNNIVAHMQGVTRADQATANASMANAQAVQGSIDRSTAGFIHYLNGTTVVQNSSGGRATVDQNFASSLVRNNPNEYEEVPVSAY